MIGFHIGALAAHQATTSTVSRRDGPGGKMYVPRREVLLDDVVLCCAAQLGGTDALLLGVGDVQGEQPRRRGIDRHRRVHLRRRDAVEQGAHVAEMADRHADLADLATSHRRIRVVAGLRRQVEGDGQAGLPLGQVRAVQLVGRRRRGVPGVGAHDPRLIARMGARIALGHRRPTSPLRRHRQDAEGTRRGSPRSLPAMRGAVSATARRATSRPSP